jgi:hypothetical protein
MWKAVLVGTAAVAIAGSTIVYAQQRGRPGLEGVQRWRPTVEDMRAFGEARLAGLKAGLMLTPEQEKNWAAFEQAAREYGKLRLDRMNAFIDARRNPRPQASDPIERLRQRGIAMADTGTVLKKLADATDPLYKSLDESQKRRFALLSRMGGERLGRGGGREFRGRDGFAPRSFDPRDGDGPRRFDRGSRRTENGFDNFAPRSLDPRDDGPRRFDRGPRRAENGFDNFAPRGFDPREDGGPRRLDRGSRPERGPDGLERDPRRFDRGPREIDRGERSL